MSIFEELGLDAEAYNNAEEQTVGKGFEVLPSGAYPATIKQLATFTTDSGAGILYCKVNIPSEDRDIEVYQNTKKKDGSPNEIGTATFKHIIQAVNVDTTTLSTKKEQIKAYGKEVTGTVVNGVVGKPFLALVRAVLEEGGRFENYNEIEAWAKADGTNAKNEDIKTPFLEKIEKTPVLSRKSKQPKQAANTGATTATQEDIAKML